MEAYKLTVTATSEGLGLCYTTTPCHPMLHWGSTGPASVSSTMSDKGPSRPRSSPSGLSATYSYSDGYKTPGSVPMDRPLSAATATSISSSAAAWEPRALPPGAVPDGYWMLGSLGPVFTSEWQARREKLLRQKAFSKAVRNMHAKQQVPQRQRPKTAAMNKELGSHRTVHKEIVDSKTILSICTEASRCILEECGDGDALARAAQRDAVAASALTV